MIQCEVCFRHCILKEGQRGFCGARICADGRVIPENYGRVTSIALDPIEKKPLKRFFPGSKIISVGSYGCNIRCPFCQNHEISWSQQAMTFRDRADTFTPEQIAALAQHYRSDGNIGAAFTYNEPLTGFEFVRDTAKLIHEAGMKNVLVTNGTAGLWVLEQLAPYIDAMNIDLKCFSEQVYRDVLGGDLKSVLDFISRAVQVCHVEITTLIVPQLNDHEEEIRQISQWISSLADSSGRVIGSEIPLHISRFFPRFRMTDRGATDVQHIYRLVDIAREQLKYVYTGNC